MFYLRGSPLSREDLLRAKIYNAKACFVMTDPYSLYHSLNFNTSSSFMEEENTNQDLLSTTYSISIKKEFGDVPVYVQILGNEVREVLSSFADRIFNVNQLKMNLLARSCIAPGSITLISNLIKSFDIPPVNSASTWLKEYSFFFFFFFFCENQSF